jgi:DnaJ-class molecular chaperone
MDISTCYQLLGISSNSTEKEIASAYKRRAMILHPDKQTILSTSLEDVSFIQIRKAYEIIMTERKRQNTLNLAKEIVKEKLSSMFS